MSKVIDMSVMTGVRIDKELKSKIIEYHKSHWGYQPVFEDFVRSAVAEKFERIREKTEKTERK